MCQRCKILKRGQTLAQQGQNLKGQATKSECKTQICINNSIYTWERCADTPVLTNNTHRHTEKIHLSSTNESIKTNAVL